MGYRENHDLAISFRDPAGRLLSVHGKIFRIINSSGIEDLTAFLGSETSRRFIDAGRIVRTKVVAPTEIDCPDSGIETIFSEQRGRMLVEHERVPFPSFPYEWAPHMLHAAASLTLDLAEELLPEGFGLKDATPYNVLFHGPEPVFVDILSFEKRDAGDATWLPYAQFIRTFLLPLLASKYFDLRLDQTLLISRDGLEPEAVYRWLKPLQKVMPPFVTLVSIPTWLSSAHDKDDSAIYRRKSLPDSEKARFILTSLFKRLGKTLRRVRPGAGARSAWSDYTVSNSYENDQMAAKEGFINQVLTKFAPRRVLDVGCNTGLFSVMAAKSGASVVAIDKDPVVVGRLWHKAYSEKLDILPLVVDLTRPSPPTGWRNLECASFLMRSCGYFDAVFMLAVIHHILVTEGVPISDLLDLAYAVTTDLLVIEFVSPEDSMFRRLTRGREELYRGLTQTSFEAACERQFEIVSALSHKDSRRLYLLRKTEGFNRPVSP